MTWISESKVAAGRVIQKEIGLLGRFLMCFV